MKLENAVVARICHDLITPFNAINLGLEAFELSPDPSMLTEVKNSANKANVFLKLIRELVADKPDTFCYSSQSLQKMIGDFLKCSNCSFSLKSDIDNIPNIAGKIVMYHGIISKEGLPYGGSVICKIDDLSGEIATVYTGKNAALPVSVQNIYDVTYKNVFSFCLNDILRESGFSQVVYEKNSSVTLIARLD